MDSKKATDIQVGKNIQESREKIGYTQEYMSELVGITPNHLSAIERGASGISLVTLKKICRILGVSADKILFGDEDKDDELADLARQIARIPPEFSKQVRSIVTSVIEIAEGAHHQEKPHNI